ncbi:MAG: hypothetical protein ACI4E1_08680 [Lachnospira sp.]
MNWFTIAIILIPFAMIFTVKYLSKMKKISYKISPWSWLVVDFVLFIFSFLLMLTCALKTIEANETPSNGSFWLSFVQQGGLILIVMVLSNMIDKLSIRSYDLDYSRGYSPINAKIQFSLASLSCSLICYLNSKQAGIDSVTSNLLYGQSVMWIINFLQIWFCFGSSSNSRLDKKSLRSKILYFKYAIKYTHPCIISIFVGPLVLIIFYYFVIIKGYYNLIAFLNTLDKVLGFESLVIAITVFLKLFHESPLRKYDVYRTKKKLSSLKYNEIKMGYYRNIKYHVYQKDDKYIITIEGLDIILDDNNSFTEKEKDDLYSLREIITDSLDMDAETVISFLDKIDEIQTNILKNAHTNIRERYIENEMKARNIMNQ